MLRFAAGLVVVLGIMAVAAPASAGFIGDSDGNTVTATAGSTESTYYASLMTDGVGMTPNDPVIKTSTMSNATFADNSWASTTSPAEADRWLLFTFANPASVNEIVIWNGNQNADGIGVPNLWQRGLKDVVITYSTGTDGSGLGHTLLSGSLHEASGQPQGYTDDLFLAGGPVGDVKAVRIAYSSNFSNGTDGVYQISEVRFAGVPEPGTLLLTTTGLIGLLAYAWQKRK
jgi:hypothetical protein